MNRGSGDKYIVEWEVFSASMRPRFMNRGSAAQGDVCMGSFRMLQ